MKARLCNIRCDVFVSDDVVDEHNKNVTLDNQVKKNTSTAAKAAAADIEAADVEGEKTLRYGFAFTSAAAASFVASVLVYDLITFLTIKCVSQNF